MILSPEKGFVFFIILFMKSLNMSIPGIMNIKNISSKENDKYKF